MDRFTSTRNRIYISVSLTNLGTLLTLFALMGMAAAASAAPSLSRVSCVSSAYNGNGTDACTVYLSSAATANVNVSLSTNEGAVIVPGSVTVATGATCASFTTTVLGVSTAQTATIKASAGGITKTFNVTLSSPTGAAALSLST